MNLRMGGFWRTFFFIIGKVGSAIALAMLLTAIIMGVLGWMVPASWREPADWIVLAMSFFPVSRMMRLLGPHLTGICAGVMTCLSLWFAQLSWYVHGTGPQLDWFLNLVVFAIGPVLAWQVYTRHVWAVSPHVYTVRPNFERVT